MKRSLFALGLLAALPFAAAAQDSSGLNYSHVQGGYTATNGDGPDADGWGIDGSVAIHPNWHLFGGYTRQTFDDDSLSNGPRVKRAHAGIGFNYPVAASTDLVARVTYGRGEGESRLTGDSDIDGWSVETGVRSELLDDRLEGYLHAGYERYDYDNAFVSGSADDFYGRVGALVKFNPSWGISGDVKFADGDTQWFVGPRFSW